jgi:hypothetical protein
MNRKTILAFLSPLLLACGCETAPQESSARFPKPIHGTWQLVRGTVIERGDTIVTDYTTGKSFIKIINDTHFAFLLHDLNQGQDSAALFASGGGTYTLTDQVYTEHLQYCSAREWEGHDFTFTLTFDNDTLIQQGTERVESAGINRVNIEKYVRVRP